LFVSHPSFEPLLGADKAATISAVPDRRSIVYAGPISVIEAKGDVFRNFFWTRETLDSMSK